MSAQEHPGDSPVQNYLDLIVVSWPSSRPRALRHLLAETEAHLLDTAAQAEAGGMSPLRAEAEAVRRFGPVDDLVQAELRRQRPSLVELTRQVVSTAVLLGAVGAIAVGLSGVVAAVFWAVGGTGALVAVAPGEQLSAADCARWLAADPTAGGCRAAALSDWAWETVAYRVVLGVLGCVVLAGYLLLRRRGGSGRWPALPRPVSTTIAVTLFTAAGVWAAGMGVDAVAVNSGQGIGQWFSAAIVALGAAALFGRRLRSDLPLLPPSDG
jgi:hypothetical protein